MPAQTRRNVSASAAAAAGGDGKNDVQGAMLDPSVVNTPWVRVPTRRVWVVCQDTTNTMSREVASLPWWGMYNDSSCICTSSWEADAPAPFSDWQSPVGSDAIRPSGQRSLWQDTMSCCF